MTEPVVNGELTQCIVANCTKVAMAEDFCEPHYTMDTKQKGKELVMDYEDFWNFVVHELRRKGRNFDK